MPCIPSHLIHTRSSVRFPVRKVRGCQRFSGHGFKMALSLGSPPLWGLPRPELRGLLQSPAFRAGIADRSDLRLRDTGLTWRCRRLPSGIIRHHPFWCASLLLPLLISTGLRKVSGPPPHRHIFANDRGWRSLLLWVYGDSNTQHRSPRKRGSVQQFLSANRLFCRHSLLTGCYANQVGISGTGSVLQDRTPPQRTIAEVVKPLGYATACFGK